MPYRAVTLTVELYNFEFRVSERLEVCMKSIPMLCYMAGKCMTQSMKTSRFII